MVAVVVQVSLARGCYSRVSSGVFTTAATKCRSGHCETGQGRWSVNVTRRTSHPVCPGYTPASPEKKGGGGHFVSTSARSQPRKWSTAFRLRRSKSRQAAWLPACRVPYNGARRDRQEIMINKKNGKRNSSRMAPD